MRPRVSDQLTSPTATSDGPSGVDRMASNVLAYFSLKKRLKVDSMSAPFMAVVAISPGATKAA